MEWACRQFIGWSALAVCLFPYGCACFAPSFGALALLDDVLKDVYSHCYQLAPLANVDVFFRIDFMVGFASLTFGSFTCWTLWDNGQPLQVSDALRSLCIFCNAPRASTTYLGTFTQYASYACGCILFIAYFAILWPFCYNSPSLAWLVPWEVLDSDFGIVASVFALIEWSIPILIFLAFLFMAFGALAKIRYLVILRVHAECSDLCSKLDRVVDSTWQPEHVNDLKASVKQASVAKMLWVLIGHSPGAISFLRILLMVEFSWAYLVTFVLWLLVFLPCPFILYQWAYYNGKLEGLIRDTASLYDSGVDRCQRISAVQKDLANVAYLKLAGVWGPRPKQIAAIVASALFALVESRITRATF